MGNSAINIAMYLINERDETDKWSESLCALTNVEMLELWTFFAVVGQVLRGAATL